MPLTKKGQRIMAKMQSQYGKEKGKQVFYSSVNKGKISGTGETSAFKRRGKRRDKRRDKRK